MAALLAVAAAWASSSVPVRAGWLLFAVGWVGPAVALSARDPTLLGKTATGQFALWRWPTLWSWWGFRYLAARAETSWTGESPSDEVYPGVWVGRWPHGDTLRALDPAAWAVVDLTAELPTRFSGEAYLAVPVLEHTPPRPDQLDAVVAFMSAQEAAGRTLYVHCAMGHTRSATAIVAWRLATKPTQSLDAVVEHLQQVRPRMGLGARHRQIVEDWRRRRE
jgi:hypothetical protein